MARIGAEALRTVLQDRADRADAARPTPPDMTREGRRCVWVRSLLGDFQIWRAYLEHNRPHMHYDLYRSQGLFIGSGVIEAGCKTVVAQRAKLSGMLWGEKGVQDVLTLRCLLLGGEIDRFWDHVFGIDRAAA